MSHQPVVNALKKLLADYYALYLKTQNYHWNVEGPRFRELHLLFEEHYTELSEAIDTLAELIRGLGEKAPGTFEAYMHNTSIKPGNESASAEKMLKDLLEDQRQIEKTLNTVLNATQEAEDEVVIGFIVDRLTPQNSLDA
ncbi:uncharacterized protein LOC111319802 [Stylophora pistillata]|uniref:uncharacterized protein LOC111319802 n=1 Tax=Stylophora pistillata TaxID=50429 RepID=UPI000C0519B0|nr:uncharacterized protein LOC111319802 [Stylophora pistillata]